MPTLGGQSVSVAVNFIAPHRQLPVTDDGGVGMVVSSQAENGYFTPSAQDIVLGSVG